MSKSDFILLERVEQNKVVMINIVGYILYYIVMIKSVFISFFLMKNVSMSYII